MTGVQLPDRRNRARGMLLGAACGDALGAGFEGHRAVVAAELLAAETASGPLTYTDDTAMMIVVTEHLLSSLHRDRDIDEAELVAAFAAAWRREPGRGYGTAPPRIFDLVGAGVPWREAAASMFGGRGSYGNGGAMRVAPVALVAESLSQTVELARRTASHHTHPPGLDRAAVQACAVALALASDPRNVLDRAGFVDRLAAHTTEPELLEPDSSSSGGSCGTPLQTGPPACSATASPPSTPFPSPPSRSCVTPTTPPKPSETRSAAAATPTPSPP